MAFGMIGRIYHEAQKGSDCTDTIEESRIMSNDTTLCAMLCCDVKEANISCECWLGRRTAGDISGRMTPCWMDAATRNGTVEI